MNLSEFSFQTEHIPGAQNVVADGLTTQRQDEDLEVLRAQNEDSEIRLLNGEAVVEKFHNSVVVHPGCDRTYKALKLSGHNWVRMKEQLKKYISECTICQKIKW